MLKCLFLEWDAVIKLHVLVCVSLRISVLQRRRGLEHTCVCVSWSGHLASSSVLPPSLFSPFLSSFLSFCLPSVLPSLFPLISFLPSLAATAAAAASLQSCPILCDPRDGSPLGSSVPGILQARTLEWVAISFSNAWKWKVKGKSLSRARLLATPWTAACNNENYVLSPANY